MAISNKQEILQDVLIGLIPIGLIFSEPTEGTLNGRPKAQKQQTAETTERQIDEARLQYVPVALGTQHMPFVTS